MYPVKVNGRDINYRSSKRLRFNILPYRCVARIEIIRNVTELICSRRAQRNTEGEVGVCREGRGKNERRDILISAKAA